MRRGDKQGRRAGAVDPLDVTIGVVAAISLPIVMYAVLAGTGAVGKSDVGRFQEAPKVEVEPDAELIGYKLEYYRTIYAGTAKELLRMATEAPVGRHRLDLKDWAKSCLKDLEAQLATLESELGEGDLARRFASQLADVRSLKESCRSDYEVASSLQ